MSGLNPRQKEAVRAIEGPVLVLAGAGSGKTRVITHKIAYLIQECGYKPHHIAAVTFTNKAAREMKERVAALLQGKEARGLRVSTFHTLGLNIIRREIAHTGYRPGFSIYDAQDSATVIRDILRQDAGNAELEQTIQHRISAWKSALVTPEEALQGAEEAADFAAAQVYVKYDRQLRAFNAVDFDDLIMIPALLFRQEPEVLQHWRGRIRYLLVDEYQDTNTTQYELVRYLVGGRGALTVVGDDDQSIYAWRGAQPENLALLKQDFPGLRVIKLEQNYRSMGCILKAANQLIGNNPHVFEKRLWSELGFGEPIRILSTRDEEHEAEKVVSDLLHHQFKHRSRHSDYAILYRGNHQSRLFERALREHRIPYQISGGTSFFAYAEVKDIMAYFKLLLNPDDDAAFLRVVNTPRREIGASTVEKLAAYTKMRGISLFAACFEMGLAQHLNARALERLRSFAEWVVDIGDRARRGDPLAAASDLVREIDYETWLLDTCKDPKAAERRMKNVYELVEWIGRMAKQKDGSDDFTEIVGKLALMDILERNNEEESGDAVRLMTLHAAKGLEFPYVYLVGMEEELLPHRTSIEEENIEEERRLAYVGITRAQRALTFSLAARRRRAGELSRCEPSRFLSELPQDDLRWEGVGIQQDPQERQERGRAHLANLRDMLG